MEIPTLIQQCHTMVQAPLEYLKKQKEVHPEQRYIGYTCIFMAEELLHAAGLTPVRLLGFSKKLVHAEKYMPTNCCEFARSILETIYGPDLNFCDGVALSHCCDTMYVMNDIAPHVYKKDIYILNSPTHFTEQAITYTNNEIEKLKKRLETRYQMTLTPTMIEKSWQTYRQNWALVRRLYELRRQKPGIISGLDTTAVLEAGLFMSKEEHNQILQQLVTHLENKEFTVNPHLKKVIVSGSTNANLALVQMIENAGCVIVDDDICETSRTIPWKIEETFEYPATLSRRLLAMYCPVKFSDFMNYQDLILNKYKSTGAHAIIFIFFPFCDPQNLELASLRQRLKQEKIRALHVEIIIGKTNFGQIQTRVEALLESV